MTKKRLLPNEATAKPFADVNPPAKHSLICWARPHLVGVKTIVTCHLAAAAYRTSTGNRTSEYGGSICPDCRHHSFAPFDLIKDGALIATKQPSLIRHPAYWFGLSSLLPYVGIEPGISTWIAEYFVTNFGAASAQISFKVSLFRDDLLV